MFYVTCKCGSRDVHHYRYKANSNTLNQYCGRCKINMTQIAVAKARKTRSKRVKFALRRAPKSRSTQSTIWGIGLVLWAIFAIGAYGATAYAEMSTITYEATTTPVIVNQIVNQPETIVKPESIHDKITRYSSKYGIEREKMRVLIGCETGWSFDPTIQSNHVFKNGVRENSWGLAQIFLNMHPNISKAEATNADFALDFIGKNWHKRSSVWYNCVNRHSL